MDNSLLGAFFFCSLSLPSSCMLRPVHENTALHHRAGKASSKTHGFLFPGNCISLFSPSLCALASRASWRDECQELSVGFAWGQNCPGAKEKAQKTQALPRPCASSVPEAVIFALFSSLCGSHPSPNPVKRRCGRCMEKAGSAARHPPPCWLLQRLKAQRQQKKPHFSVNVSLCSPALPFLSTRSSV